MAADLFDQRLSAMRRDRAARQGPELFLHERAFEDVLDRLALIRRRFRSALLIGCVDTGWHERLLQQVDEADVVSGERLQIEPGCYDLCIIIGTLDTVNDLPDALLRIRLALQEDSLFLGALPGGETLPRLRAAMRAADEAMRVASPHVHPRIEPAALAGLLTSVGFSMPVVDVDRVQVGYRSLWDLIRDLRAMGATNVLTARSRRPLTRAAVAAAVERFESQVEGGRVIETFELLHFAAWTPIGAPSGHG